MPKPSTTATSSSREGLIVFGLLALALYAVYYRNFTQMGVYEDDWYAIVPFTQASWSEVRAQVWTLLTHWPNGRPLGLGMDTLGAYFLYKIGGLAGLYVLPFSTVLACAWALYRLLRESLGLLPAFFGAVTFALLPIDTVRLSLHGAALVYVAVLFLLLAAHVTQRNKDWLVAPITFVGLLFHESSTLSIFAVPLLFFAWNRVFAWRLIRYWGYAFSGLASVFVLRIGLFSEARAASAFTNIFQVVERSLTSLRVGTATHWTLIGQRCRDGLHFSQPDGLPANLALAGIFALVLLWQRRPHQPIVAENQTRGITPLKVIIFGLVAMSLPYLTYFTEGYWPANHVAGRMASVHSSSGVGFAFLLAGILGGVSRLRLAPVRWGSISLATFLLAGLLSWGNGVRLQYLEAWRNQQAFWSQIIPALGNIKSGTIILFVRDNYWDPPFTWVIGSHAWSDAIVLQNLYYFPTHWNREPRLFYLAGPWQEGVRADDGRLIWQMPAGQWPTQPVTLEQGNVMIFKLVAGRPVALEGEIELAGQRLLHESLPRPSAGLSQETFFCGLGGPPAKMNVQLSIVVPVYKEERNISEFLRRLRPILASVTEDYEIIFSLDPSPDRTEEVIIEQRLTDPRIMLLKFSRRFGQPMATLAGLEYSRGEAVIVMDVDLQDPPELVHDMVAKWREGYDIVLPQRRARTGEPWIKKLIAATGYKVINKIADVKIPPNTGDFRLMTRRVVAAVVRLKESHGFLRGMVAVVGFKQILIPFDRPQRFAGETNYNRFLGSLRIGFNGIFCFSTYALTLSTIMGFAIAGFSFLLMAVYLFYKFMGWQILWGNPTLVILISFLGGIQLISVGILGEYIGRIYEEVRARPKFIVDRAEGFNK